MIATENLGALSAAQLRQTVQLLMSELRHKTALVDKLTHEMAVLKRLKFAAKSEAYTAEQKSLSPPDEYSPISPVEYSPV